MHVYNTDASVGVWTDAGFDIIPFVFSGVHGNLVRGRNAACKKQHLKMGKNKGYDDVGVRHGLDRNRS